MIVVVSNLRSLGVHELFEVHGRQDTRRAIAGSRPPDCTLSAEHGFGNATDEAGLGHSTDEAVRSAMQKSAGRAPCAVVQPLICRVAEN
jgi:hypothetical protein